MKDPFQLAVVSDIHYAGPAEQARGGHEPRAIPNPVLRLATRVFRHYVWLRNPFVYNHLLDRFMAEAARADFVVVNGDLSCDTAFVGVSDDAARASVEVCLEKLRTCFTDRLAVNLGDHELGKMSLFGGHGGPRLRSWHLLGAQLGLAPFWQASFGRYRLLGVTSSLVALPVYEPETLPEERSEWWQLRTTHLAQVQSAFSALRRDERVILFCHDPTALPFLWREEAIRSRLTQVEHTVIGHLHTNLVFWKSRLLAGMPAIGFLGNSVRRMSTALRDAGCWKDFHVVLCPSLAGSELLKDGGYCWLTLDLDAKQPASFRFQPLPRSAGQ